MEILNAVFKKKTFEVNPSETTYNTTMSQDFERVKQIVETTKNPMQFDSLDNLVDAFANKWNPDNFHCKYWEILSPVFVNEYRNDVNYLKLKLNFEYEKAI